MRIDSVLVVIKSKTFLIIYLALSDSTLIWATEKVTFI